MTGLNAVQPSTSYDLEDDEVIVEDIELLVDISRDPSLPPLELRPWRPLWVPQAKHRA